MYKNYIFDFGNVLADFDTVKLTLAEVDGEEGARNIEKVVFDRKYWDKLDSGTITDEEIKSDIKTRLNPSDYRYALRVYDNWVYNLKPFDGMLDLIKELKSRDKKLYLLSNIAKDFREKYLKNKEISEMLSLFDGLVLSGEIGMVKPDGKIFDYLFKKYNINPKESVFVDDNILNIEGAKRAGLNICLYKLNINDLKKEIMF